MGHKQFTQGGVGLDDFVDTIKHVKKADPKKHVKKRGCPGNDYKAHVYVWVPEVDTSPWKSDREFFDFYGFHKYEYKICAGCEKRTNFRLTEEYTKKFKQSGRWGSAEYKDPAYMKSRERRWRTWDEVKADRDR